MRKILGAVAAVVLFACGSPSGTSSEPSVAPPSEGLSLAVEQGSTQGTFATGGTEVKFSSRQVEPSVYRIEVRYNGMSLTGLVDAGNPHHRPVAQPIRLGELASPPVSDPEESAR